MDEFANRKYPLNEHFHFQRRMWMVERIGWCVLAAIPLLALTGLFGGGSLRTVNSDALTVQYERFERRTRLAQFKFQFRPTAAAERSLHLSRAFQDTYEVTSVQPGPILSRADASGLGLSFAGSPGSGNTIVIWARPRQFGSMVIEARADAAPAVQLPVLVYP